MPPTGSNQQQLPPPPPPVIPSSSSGVKSNSDWRDYVVQSDTDLHNARYSHNYSAQMNSDADKSSSNDVIGSGNKLIPLYCGMMGLIILGLALYVIYKHCHRHRMAKTQEKHCHHLYAHRTPAATAGLHLKKPTTHTFPTSHPKHDHRPLSCLSERALSLVKAALSKSNEPAMKDWTVVAKELGYALGEIVAFSQPSTAVTSAHGRQPSCSDLSAADSVDAFLRDWMARDCATIGQFCRALHHTQRHDVIQIIVDNCSPASHHRLSTSATPLLLPPPSNTPTTTTAIPTHKDSPTCLQSA